MIVLTEPFPNITDNFALNFLNSRIKRNNQLIELIPSIDALKKWSNEQQALLEGNRHQIAQFHDLLDSLDDLSGLLSFRNELHQLLSQISCDAAFVSVLKGKIEAQLAENPLTLKFFENEPSFIPLKNGLEGIKSLLMLSLSELLASNELSKLAHCQNQECLLLFINKSGRRKWCSMKICGNRHKVERFEKKLKEEQSR